MLLADLSDHGDLNAEFLSVRAMFLQAFAQLVLNRDIGCTLGCEFHEKNLEVIDRLLSILEEERPARENPAMKARGLESYEGLKTFVPDRPGHDRRYAIDPTRIQRDLGWRPRFDFDQGFRKTVRWYLDNREWCEKVTAGAYDRERLGLGATGRKP